MGDSSVTSPWGETLVSAAGAETVLLVDVDPGQVKDARAKFPVLKDRSPRTHAEGRGQALAVIPPEWGQTARAPLLPRHYQS
jgi:predicted amidohydrolase